MYSNILGHRFLYHHDFFFRPVHWSFYEGQTVNKAIEAKGLPSYTKRSVLIKLLQSSPTSNFKLENIRKVMIIFIEKDLSSVVQQ